MQEARFAIDEVLAKGNHYQHRMMDFNNDPNTTFADVEKFFILDGENQESPRRNIISMYNSEPKRFVSMQRLPSSVRGWQAEGSS
jgi:hypothetical protein